jgi:phosphomannomutase
MTKMNTPSDKFPHEIFKAYDIRGIVDKTLTTDITRQIGQAFGSEALSRGVDTVVIARDGRLSGPALNAALAEGLLASGCNVIDIGMVPTPMLYFATYHLNTGTGIMITGSHNPPEYNGLKMVMAGETLAGDRSQAFGSEALSRGVDTVVIARDGRLSGPALNAALAEGLLASGCNVIDIGMVPTPMLYFATYHLNTGTGIMITGSHNPPEYNGLKMVMAGETLAGERIQDLKQRILDGNFSNGHGQLSEQDIKSAYSERILSEGRLSRELHAVVDCGNGVASEIAPELLAELGCKVTPLFCETDGNFPNHHPDPSQPDTLVDLIRAMHETGADIGLAFDGDGDRLGVVTPDGKIIWPDRQLILYASPALILSTTSNAHKPLKLKSTGPAAKPKCGKPATPSSRHAYGKQAQNWQVR